MNNLLEGGTLCPALSLSFLLLLCLLFFFHLMEASMRGGWKSLAKGHLSLKFIIIFF